MFREGEKGPRKSDNTPRKGKMQGRESDERESEQIPRGLHCYSKQDVKTVIIAGKFGIVKVEEEMSAA
jgi:hypothetical protein